MGFETPTKDGTKLANGQHQADAAELAKARVFIGLRNLFEPIEKLQIQEEGQFKGQPQNTAGMLKFGAAGGVMQTEMTDAHKAIREDMREKAADKLQRRQSHQFFFAIVTVIEIFEGDRILANRHNAMIGNGNAEDIATEILDQLRDAIERGLNVDFPVFRQRFGQQVLNIESAVIRIEFAICPELGERKTKAMAELIGKQLDGKEKLVRSRLPTIASGG